MNYDYKTSGLRFFAIFKKKNYKSQFDRKSQSSSDLSRLLKPCIVFFPLTVSISKAWAPSPPGCVKVESIRLAARESATAAQRPRTRLSCLEVNLNIHFMSECHIIRVIKHCNCNFPYLIP